MFTAECIGFMFKRSLTAGAGLAAAAILTFTGMQSSGAVAQESDSAPAIILPQTEVTDEIVPENAPVFVEKEVAQPLPAESAETELTLPTIDETPRAASLRELVAMTPTDGALSEELQCLAGAVYFESRGEPLDGQLAVAQVIINRAESGQFPESYCSVVHQRSQFSFVKNGRMPQPRTSSAAWTRAKAIARIAHRGLWDSAADDSLYFHAKYVRPSWSRKKVARATIDSHIFYR